MKLKEVNKIAHTEFSARLGLYGFIKQEYNYTSFLNQNFIYFAPGFIEYHIFRMDYMIGVGNICINQIFEQALGVKHYWPSYVMSGMDLFKLGRRSIPYYDFDSTKKLVNAINDLVSFVYEYYLFIGNEINSLYKLYKYIENDLEYFIKLTSGRENSVCSFMILARHFEIESYYRMKSHIQTHLYYQKNMDRYYKIITFIESISQEELATLLMNNSDLKFESMQTQQWAATTSAMSVESSIIKGFDVSGEPEIQIEPEGSLLISFNFMPPLNGQDEPSDDPVFDEFDQVLARALQTEVIWDDRERFLIPHPKPDTYSKLVNFLNTFWEHLEDIRKGV